MLLIRHWHCGNSAVLLTESEFLLILQQGKPRRRTEIVITGKCILPLWGASEGTRFPLLMQPFSARCLLRFHGHAIRGQCLFFLGFKGHGNTDWPIICRLYPIYHRCIVRVIRFNRVSMPRKSEKTKISPSSPPRYAHAFFYLSDRWPGPMQKPWTIYFNGRGIKRTGTRVPLTIIRVAVEKQTS